MTIASCLNFNTFVEMAVPLMVNWPGVTRVSVVPEMDALSLIVNYGTVGASLVRITHAQLRESDNPWDFIKPLWDDVMSDAGSQVVWTVISPYLLEDKEAE